MTKLLNEEFRAMVQAFDLKKEEGTAMYDLIMQINGSPARKEVYLELFYDVMQWRNYFTNLLLSLRA